LLSYGGRQKCQIGIKQDLKEKVQKQEDKWEIVKVQILLVEAQLGEQEEVVETEEVLEMPRPCRRRRVRGNPCSFYFKPAGIPKFELEEVILEIDEFEAIRLKDQIRLEQEECAKQMAISQPTFHRILNSGRRKIADSIVKGKALKIVQK
jgi:uncharacterized protein